MKLSIIFVNWNSTDYLRECIASIYEWSSNGRFEIIVVDNASPRTDIDVLKQQFDGIKLLKSTHNLGFARANNLAVKHSSGEHLLFLNPDTKLLSSAIDTLLHRLESLPDAGIVGCRLLNGDLSLQTSCIQTFPTILNQVFDADFLRNRWPNSRLWGIAPLFTSTAKPVAVEVISGACMLVKRDVFEKLGMFDEEYFMYAEDVDLCYRATRAGYRNYFVGEAEVIHYGGKSSTPLWAAVKKWESLLRYCAKNHGYCYTFFFRMAMVAVAAARLGLIAGLFPLGVIARRKRGPSLAFAKWSAILKTLLRSPSSPKLLKDA